MNRIFFSDVVSDLANRMDHIYDYLVECFIIRQLLNKFLRKMKNNQEVSVKIQYFNSPGFLYLYHLNGQMYILFYLDTELKYLPITEIPSYISIVCCDKCCKTRGCITHDLKQAVNFEVLNHCLRGLYVKLDGKMYCINSISSPAKGVFGFHGASEDNYAMFVSNVRPHAFISLLDVELKSEKDCKRLFERCAIEYSLVWPPGISSNSEKELEKKCNLVILRHHLIGLSLRIKNDEDLEYEITSISIGQDRKIHFKCSNEHSEFFVTNDLSDITLDNPLITLQDCKGFFERCPKDYFLVWCEEEEE
jgi:hypothetical protein